MTNGSRPRVTIVGAGIAGLSAALWLLEAGCDVTAIERKPSVGGKFGTEEVDGIHHEHAYHFFGEWYLNFWDLVDKIGLDKQTEFEARSTIKFLPPRKGGAKAPYDFRELRSLGSSDYFWTNVNSRLMPWPDMLIYLYSVLDLLSDQTFEREEFLNRVSVNGFMRSRGYATDLAALLHQEALLKAFAVPSYETSVRSYQKFLQLVAAYPDPGVWVLRGNCFDAFWKPFLDKLYGFNRRGRKRFTLQTSTTVKEITLARDGGAGPVKVSDIVTAPHGDEKRAVEVAVDRLIVAVPPGELAKLVRRSARLREVAPELLNVERLRSQQMASLDLSFVRRLDGIPRDHVTLVDPENRLESRFPQRNGIASEYGLSFIDNSQLWPSAENTMLNVVASDFEVLRGLDRDEARGMIMAELGRYLKFGQGDIDEKRSHFQTHEDAPLFVNSVGSWQCRPEVRPDAAGNRIQDKVSHLYLAGDYCRSKIDIVSIEGAILTGIWAARAISERVAAPRLPERFDPGKVEEAKASLKTWLALAQGSAARSGRRRA